METADHRQQQLMRSWISAAEDLGIEVEQNGNAIVVRSFGTKAGTLCSAIDNWKAMATQAEEHGMAASGLGDSYLAYERDLFIDTLNDWGWCGEGDPPPWYSGRPWSG